MVFSYTFVNISKGGYLVKYRGFGHIKADLAVERQKISEYKTMIKQVMEDRAAQSEADSTEVTGSVGFVENGNGKSWLNFT